MRHELAQGDRRAGAVVGGEAREVAAHGGVDVDLAALGQLHDGDVGEQLRNRTHTVDGGGGGGDAGGLLSEACRPRDALVVDQRDRHRRETLLVALALDHGFEGARDVRVRRAGRDPRGAVRGAGRKGERERQGGGRPAVQRETRDSRPGGPSRSDSGDRSVHQDLGVGAETQAHVPEVIGQGAE